jgi:hypothetical protein
MIAKKSQPLRDSVMNQDILTGHSRVAEVFGFYVPPDK